MNYLAARHGLQRLRNLASYLIAMPEGCATGVGADVARDIVAGEHRGSVMAIHPHAKKIVRTSTTALEASVHPERILVAEVQGAQVKAVRELVDSMRRDVHLLSAWLKKHEPKGEGDAGVVGQQGEGAAPLPCPRDPDLRPGNRR